MSKLKRFGIMIAGNVLIGIGVAGLRMSLFGTDPFTCMNLGVSSFIHMGFGTWQLICNALLLVFVWCMARNKIGLGTLVNMTLVGYMSDLLCWICMDQLQLELTMPFRMIWLLMSVVILSCGCAMYMQVEMGIAPYDALAMILSDQTNGKISFQAMRIFTDLSVMGIGICFGLLAGTSLSALVGVGTVITAFCMGPLIGWFRKVLFSHPAMQTAVNPAMQ